MNFINCPNCGNKIKKTGNTLHCQCGWHKSLNQTKERQIQNKIAKNIFIAGLTLMGFVVYVGNWGSASLTIMPLKARQWTGTLNEKSFQKLTSLCLQLKKYNCTENAHRSFFRSSNDMKILAKLGEFQYRRNRLESASKTYKEYFTKKGSSVKAAYNYARILEKQGQVEFALSYYKYALNARPNTVQITVMRAYINLLVKSGQVNKARQELVKFKPILKRSGSLVQQEYERWQKQTI